MTIILKSNVAFAGASDLGEINVVTKSAAEIYTAYAARVAADGGTMQDAAGCLAAITAALAAGYFDKAGFAFSARWGIKLAGAQINKFYNLVDPLIDGICTGTVMLDVVTKAWATALFSTNADIVTFSGVNVMKAGNIGLVASATRATANTGCYTAFTPVAEQWQMRPYPSSTNGLYVNAVKKSGAAAAAVNDSAYGIFVEQAIYRVTEILDGVPSISVTNAWTPIANNLTATFTILPVASPFDIWKNEEWYFNAATQDALLDCSFDVGARY